MPIRNDMVMAEILRAVREAFPGEHGEDLCGIFEKRFITDQKENTISNAADAIESAAHNSWVNASTLMDFQEWAHYELWQAAELRNLCK